ncbi:GMP synthase [Enterobacterales bacterium CwR94]|nr:GMP synthase [Enterobacterales bacterium CwR94]
MRTTSNAPLAIIQLQTPPDAVRERVGEQHHWFIRALNLQPQEYVVCRPDLGQPLPAIDSVSGAVLSGSWAMVTDLADWSERTAAWIREAMAAALPLLGVCYGHQLMAHALGGVVADNPHGWERGLQQLTMSAAIKQDALLGQFPQQFPAWLSHRQSVITPPPGSEVLATSALDACQILRYGPHALSVQFHPEFTGDIMTACLQNVKQEGVSSLMARQVEPEWARRVLTTFWQHVGQREQGVIRQSR